MKKLIASVIALIVTTVVIFSAQSVAFFSDKIETNPVITISGANLAGELIETTIPAEGGEPIVGSTPMQIRPGATVNKSIAVRNTGSMDMYVRLSLEKEFLLADKYKDEPVDLDLVYFEIDENYWEYDGEFYYYKAPLSHGEITEPLFTNVMFSGEMGNMYEKSTITFRINAYAVQVDGNWPSVFEAQGWPDAQ